MRSLPAPVMRAPILLRQSATSPISGSRAAFSITVVPRASAAAINAVCVPPTVTLGKTISAPCSPRFADARQQRPDHPKARAHARHQFVRRRGIDDVRSRDVQRLAVVGGFAGALATHHDVDAVIVENA